MRLWRDVRAACQGADVNMFFDLSRPGNKEKALDLCRRCLVRADCLAASMDEEAGSQKFGIRGGLTAEERRKLAKRQEARAKAA